MIIQELCHYYDRLAENPDISISPPGFSREKIHAEIVLDKEGRLLQFNDLRIQKGKKLVPRDMIVPQAFKRSGQKAYEKPNFLWDNTGFVLGADGDNDPKTKLKFDFFKKLHKNIYENTPEENLKTMLMFLDKWDPRDTPNLNNWKELASGNIVFRLDGERVYFHEKKSLRDIWIKYYGSQSQGNMGYCLVSGSYQPIARIHPDIKNVKDAQPKGASIISFNAEAYESYGKEQNFNAPVGETSAFSYATALNYLLANDSRQKIQIGDATTVFWTERESPIEGMFGMMLDPKDLDISDNAELRQALESIREGKPIAGIDQEIRFFILGLSPNAARVAVRFWYVCTVGQLEDKIGQHFRDLNLRRSFDSDPEYPGIWRLLRETVNQKASDKSPQPLLAGAVLRSILEGTAYPQALQNAVINRIRADQEINYVRAAILKAILVRKYRLYKQGMEVSMALDTENENPAYLLGRLFAVLEKAQQEASPGLNATIKDRFWGAASATPKVVFPQLLNLKNHHISKIDNQGKAIFFEKLVGGIMDQIESTGFKAHLTLDEQGLFAIGYYHQRQNFFKIKDTPKDDQQ